MSKQSVEQCVISLAKKILPGAANRAVTRDMDLVMDLDADSLSLVSLIFAINEELGVGTADMGTLVTESRTVGDLISAVERLTKS
jgi:acyl carrier protein